MKVTFSPTNKKERLRILKSHDMALALWEIKHNLYKKMRWMEEAGTLTPEAVSDLINEIIDFDTDELVD